ncbi:MAG: hemagglutinin repeat-containing protein, partial [Saezia sp.]
MRQISYLQKATRLTVAYLVILGQVVAPLSAYSQIVADPNAGVYRPDVTTPPNTNNVPVVNITAPNAAGVSHNQYDQFNVGQQGAILNNNATNSQTQLAGWIQGNTNLAPGQNARIILNEVTSGNPSMLAGYIEVAGQRAEVIIANPAGIAVNGGGFINASSATLTTGKPQFGMTGNLEAYRVGGGNARIAINGEFDTSTVDYTRIIARAVQINTGIWAKDLTIAAGTGDFTPHGAPIQLTVEDAAGKPLFAIDVAALGGMYAGKIHLIGTEAGVGVRNAGHIGASVGEVRITAEGRLLNSGTLNAQNHINLQTTEIDNQGTLYSQGTLTASTRNVINAGTLASSANMTLQAQDISNQQNALIAAGLNKEGQLANSATLSINTSNTLTNAGTLVGMQTTALSGGSILNAQSGEIISGNTVNINITSLTNRGLIDGVSTHLQAETITYLGTGRIYGDHVALQAQTLTNKDEGAASAVIAARDRMDIGVQTLYNHNEGLLYSVGDMYIGGSLDGSLNAAGSATLVQNDGAVIESGGNMTITTQELQNLNTAYEDAVVAQGSENIFDHVVGGSVINNKDDVMFFKEDGSQDYTVGGYFTTNTLQEAKDGLGGSSNWFMLSPSSIYTKEQTVAIFNLGGLRTLPNNIRSDYELGGQYYSAWSILGVEAPQTGDSATVIDQKFNALQVQVWRFRNDIESRKVSQETMRQYVQTHYRTEVVQSKPGELIAGGNMTLTGATTNDKSRILAGQSIIIDGNINNIAAMGEDYLQNVGTQINTSRTASGRSWSATTSLNQTTGASAIDLNITQTTANASITNRNLNMDGGTITTPSSSLYQINPGADKNYLIETDSRFTNYAKWLSSDHILDALGINPNIHKRLGDGFYEQQLIREQVGQLTGYRYLAGYQSDEEQYKALMNAGVEFAQEYDLQIGIALTAEQMKALTTDIIWLVSKNVTLPDGSVESVLVPQVYASSGSSLIHTGGTLISANNAYLGGENKTLNNLATIAARGNLVVDAANIKNTATGQLHGNNTVLHAQNNIENIGGTISAHNQIEMIAGGDILHASTITEGVDQHGGMSNIGNTGLIYLSGEDAQSGNIHIQAGGDIRLQGAAIINESLPQNEPEARTGSSSGSTTLIAGGDIHIGTVTTSQNHNVRFDSKNHLGVNTTTEQGSQILTSGDIRMAAGNNLTIRGSELESEQGAITATADTIRIEAGEQHTHNNSSFYNQNTRLGGSKKQEWRYETVRTDLVGSSLSADQIHLQSTGDMSIHASDVVSTKDINLISTAGNIAIQSGTGQDYSSSFHSKKTTGISSAGFGVHIGTTKETTQQSSQGTYAHAAVVGSLEGSVNIQAKEGTYTQVGSDVMALQGDINVLAQDITITEAREQRRDDHRYEYKQSGLSVSITSPVIAAAQTVQQMSDAADRTSSDRMKALATGAAALSIANNAFAMKGVMQNMAAGGEGSGAIESGAIGINISLGSSKSQNTSTNTSDTAHGSQMTAGGNINLTATGKQGEQQNSGSGNIFIQGSDISGKGDVNLTAANNVNILAAANSTNSTNSSKSSSSALGVSISSAGVGISISGSKGKGSGYGDETYWSSSTVTAGNTLNITSGKDTNIIGSQVSGETVKADIGGDLNIISLQNTYQGEQHQSDKSASLGITFGPTMGINGSYNQSKVDAEGNYASVGDYAGIMAGDGGFQINVGGNTHLGGSVIASTQEAVNTGKNELTTGSLTTSNIDNWSEYEVEGKSSGISTSFTPGGGLPGLIPGIPLKGKESESESSTTQAGISGGTITITNEEKQQELTGQTGEETIESINRDVITGELDTNSLDKDWDLQQKVDEMKANLEITQAAITQSQQLVDTLDKHEAKAWQDKEAILKAGEIDGVPLTDAQKFQLAMEIAELKSNSIWGMGGNGRLIVTAINGALSGNVGGTGTDVLQGALVNFIQGKGATLIKGYLEKFEGTDAERESLRG